MDHPVKIPLKPPPSSPCHASRKQVAAGERASATAGVSHKVIAKNGAPRQQAVAKRDSMGWCYPRVVVILMGDPDCTVFKSQVECLFHHCFSQPFARDRQHDSVPVCKQLDTLTGIQDRQTNRHTVYYRCAI
eukprot:1804955-Rhodomonas_salina.1